MSYKFSVVLEKDDNGYFAYCPELEGCYSQGKNYEEAIKNFREAIELYIETMSVDEIKQSVSKEVINTTIEVKVA